MAEQTEEIRAALSLPLLSPSAPFELRARAFAITEAMNPEFRFPWWGQYPEGQCAAAIFRCWRAMGQEFWEIPGHELPEALDG